MLNRTTEVYGSHSWTRILQKGSEVAQTLKNAVFLDVTPCGSCNNRRFEGTYRLHHQGDKNQRPNSFLILYNLMTEAIRSSETSVLIRATRGNIPEDGILHSHRRKNLKTCIALTGWAL
jgi:hypothetical protein